MQPAGKALLAQTLSGGPKIQRTCGKLALPDIRRIDVLSVARLSQIRWLLQSRDVA